MKKSSLISIVNRLYLNANNEQTTEEDTVEEIDGTSKPTLKRNKKEKTKTPESPVRFSDFEKTSGDLPYDMCPHCCQTFGDHQVYTEHLKTHEAPVISLGPQTGSAPTKCEYCDLRFSNEYLLKEHKNVHCRICSICSKTLMTAFDLNLHMGLHSGFNYDCKDCGRCFPDRKTLAIHNKMHRSDLSANDSDEEKINKEQLSKENQKKVSFRDENHYIFEYHFLKRIV
ncbi:hypothetical protein FO519_005705 [Halicephalobus sp. NKZ332]|nr:hypothetical protein FO519_005705 [Halicephalobus sp. NKZ332]